MMENKEKWQKWFERCLVCGRNDVPYGSNGLCQSCYHKKRYKTMPKVRQYYKDKTNDWRLKNPERWLEINQKAVNKMVEKRKEGKRKL